MSQTSVVSLISVPVPDGKLDEWKAFLAELEGERRAEWDDHQRRLNVIREHIWHQRLAGVDVIILCIEGAAFDEVAEVLDHSSHPFDRWFHDRLEAIFGFVTEYPPGTTEPELIAVWTSDEA